MPDREVRGRHHAAPGREGQCVLDHNALWFLKVSGGENRRLIPQDHEAFFKLKAKEVEEALKAEGVTDVTVTVEQVYEEFAAMFTKPNQSYAPPGHPEEFSMIVPRTLCVNFVGQSPGGPSVVRMPSVAPQKMSIFARIKAAREQANNHPVNPGTRKAKAA